MNCLFSTIVVALSVILCTVGVQSVQKVIGPCNMNSPSTPPKIGQYVPQCTSMGLFQIIQKHPSTGYSWCVNPLTGDKVEGSDVKPGFFGPFFLGGILSGQRCGKCFYDLEKYVVKVGMMGIGGHSPECDAQGLFKTMQTSASTGTSWCVDAVTGEKVEGSEPIEFGGKTFCEGRQKRQAVYGPCSHYAETHPTSSKPMPGQYKPQCNEFDMFEIVQRHSSTGYSWCVNPMTGEKVEGSDVKPGSPAPKCGQCLYDLYKFHYNQAMWGFGGGAGPQCDAKGNYKN